MFLSIFSVHGYLFPNISVRYNGVIALQTWVSQIQYTKTNEKLPLLEGLWYAMDSLQGTNSYVYFIKFHIHLHSFSKISLEKTKVIALKAEEVLKVLT